MTERNHIDDVLEAEAQSIGKFTPLWDDAERNSEIYGLKHWTTEEESAIVKQGRIPYKFDKMSHAVNVLLGIQRDTRFDIFFYERNMEDGPRAEILNASWKYFGDKYDFIHVESDVFQDAVVAKYGVLGCEIDKTRDVRGDLRVSRVPYNEVIWDTNFRQYDLSDAYWMSRMRFYRREELKKRFPEHKELIDLAGLDTNWAERGIDQQSWFKADKDLVGAREFYEKQWVRKHFIYLKGSPDVEETPYASKKDAEAVIMERLMKMTQAVMSGQYDPRNGLPEWDIVPMDVQVIKKSEVLINGVLEEPEEFPLGDFPYTVNFSYFHDGEFWSVVDRLKDPQKFINRMFIQLDHAVGTMAKGLLVGSSQIPDKEWKKIEEGWGKTGGAMRTKYFDRLKEYNSQGVAPQLFSILDRADTLMDESMGGANFLGLKQSSSESGRAVLARQAQAGMDFFVPLDNLRRTKQNLGVKIAWYLANELSAPRVMRITGDLFDLQALEGAKIGKTSPFRPSVAYIEVNTKPENTINGLEVDVIVDEAAHSPTKNQAIIAALVDAGKAGVLTAPPPPSVIIKLLPLPASLKQEWLQAAEQAASQQKEPIAKPVNVAYGDLDPQAQVQVQTSLGITPNPAGVMSKLQADKPHLTQNEKESASR